MGWDIRAARSAWRRRRSDAAGLRRPAAERARTPGRAVGADREPGGGVVRFARAALRVRVAAGGAVFCGWDGAGPEPSYALSGPPPGADPRAVLEPDTDGGWRVVSERVTVAVSRLGAVEVRTPGGALLRRDLPPRWWSAVDDDGAGPRWVQRAQVAADAALFGLGGRVPGPRLRDGVHRLWQSAEDGGGCVMPVVLVVADAGSHLVFHDDPWEGLLTVREGAEGAGSAHDRPGRCELRMAGGPLRYWVVTGTPARVLHGWTSLTGGPALPPRWALGHQRLLGAGAVAGRSAAAVAAGYRKHGLPLTALHAGAGFPPGGAPGPEWDAAPGGVRLVSAAGTAVRAAAGDAVHDAGAALNAFVRDARGLRVRWSGPDGGEAFCPDFTDPQVRKWWGRLYAGPLQRGVSGFVHEAGPPSVPRSARHVLEGRGGDHREAHNLQALAMAHAGVEGLLAERPGERPLVVSRAGWAGMQRYGGAWCGTAAGDWAQLRAVLGRVLGLGLSGVPYCGADVAGGPARPDEELYLRALQLCAFLPFFRSAWDPWEFSPEVLRSARAVLWRRERLMPYLVTLTRLARRTGAPCVRPVWWQHARDRTLRGCEDAFLLGDALLVAPVLAAGVRRRRVRIPRGRWHDPATGELFDGPREVEVDAPLSRVPVLVRAGVALPVAGADGGTELEVWAPAPGRHGSGLLIPDAGDGWDRSAAVRLTVREVGGEIVVARQDGAPAGYPVRVRG
jgi:alpha-glucosidase